MNAAPVIRLRAIPNARCASSPRSSCCETRPNCRLIGPRPGEVNDAQILRAHSAGHLARLNEPEDFDADTPFYENIADYARASVAAALERIESGARR